MEISSEEGAMPIPINSTYGGGGHGHMNMIHHEAAPHNHIIPVPQMGSNNGPIPTILEDHVPYKKVVRYRECLKNHAATMGGNATDGCGEFMPSGSEGTLEALTCSACNCHRNFHRKETEGDHCYNNAISSPHLDRLGGRKLILGHHHHSLGYPTRGPLPAHQMIMSYNVGSVLPSESDDQEDVHGGAMPRQQMVKKRFRTKFTQEQKEKMLNFAEKVGWKIQKQEESVVQHFCQQVGVKRRVLKVWMHNNKHNLAKKDPSPSAENQI